MAKLNHEVTHFAKIFDYPCGIRDIVAADKPIFRESGWEVAQDWGRSNQSLATVAKVSDKKDTSSECDIARSMRRARAKVRRLALANDFRWFVTLTLDPLRIDRYCPETVVRKLSQWCNNQVKRAGLKYILVPERHKDGALHFHGFFNDCVKSVDSGHKDSGGRPIYNLPAWTLGFTAAIEIYGDYAGAVAYVCKYIGKQGDKPAGRWYYSGGNLAEPVITYGEISPDDLLDAYGDRCFQVSVPGSKIAVVNGLKGESYELGQNAGEC